MEELTNSMYAEDKNKFLKLWDILDKDKFASWFALMNLTGSHHTDISHNHTYYFDPRIGKIEPGINDILALGALNYNAGLKRIFLEYYPDHTLPINEKLFPLLSIALKDPEFYHLRNEKLYKALKTFGSTDNQTKLLNDMFEMIYHDVAADKNKSYLAKHFIGYFRAPMSFKFFKEQKNLLEKYIENRNNFLKKELENSNLFVNYSKTSDGLKIILGVDGNISLDLTNKLSQDNLYYIDDRIREIN